MRLFWRVCLIFLMTAVAHAGGPPKKAIALTFDDLPLAGEKISAAHAKDVNQRILAALRKHHAPAVGFVNEAKLEGSERSQRIGVLNLWLESGQLLGNHTYSHPDFNDRSLAEFTADAERGEIVLRQVLETHKQQLRFFRYPFNHTGNDLQKKAGFEKWLAEHHYQIATCTVENSDYLFNSAYVAAVSGGDTAKAARIRTSYLDFTESMLRYYEHVAMDLSGRTFPQVFLAHANLLNADSVDELLTRMENSGYSFVSLEEAQSDPVYQTPDSYVGRFGPMWSYRWAAALGKKIDVRSEPEPPKWITE